MKLGVQTVDSEVWAEQREKVVDKAAAAMMVEAVPQAAGGLVAAVMAAAAKAVGMRAAADVDKV